MVSLWVAGTLGLEVEEGPVRVDAVPKECWEGAVMDGVMVTLELRDVIDWSALIILGRRVSVPELELLLSAW